MSSRPGQTHAYEIGIVMAGAASAGAYTAGVLDFLIEALQCWEEAKATGDPAIPDHTVKISVAAGSSAGGIAAALLAMLPFTGHFPMRDLADISAAAEAENASNNLLYRAWVTETDLRDMLSGEDLERCSGRVPSLLNGSGLARVADGAVAAVRAAIASAPHAPNYFANPFQLYLPLTNMRGLPYMIHMVADETLRGHRVTSHSDYAHFAVLGGGPGEARSLPRGALFVNWPGTSGRPYADGWDALRDAALATSAFPGGLPARRFRNPISAYQERIKLASAPGCQSIGVSLDLPLAESDVYDFWCVDGGLLDNEPFEYARAALIGPSSCGAAHDGMRADRSVLLIDPFPNALPLVKTLGEEEPDLIDSLCALVPMLRAHAAFKPQELILALDEEVRSRYLITPIRETMREGENSLASDGLAGFAGFVHEQFRLHDFQLGRRNCQQFLRNRFHLHVDNPIVRGWVQRLKARGDSLERYQPACFETGAATAKRHDLIQVIPLMDQVRREVTLRPWPKLDRQAQFDPLERLIRQRADAVVPALIRLLLRRFSPANRRLTNRMLRAVAINVITGRIGKSAARAIERDLRNRRLLT